MWNVERTWELWKATVILQWVKIIYYAVIVLILFLKALRNTGNLLLRILVFSIENHQLRIVSTTRIVEFTIYGLIKPINYANEDLNTVQVKTNLFINKKNNSPHTKYHQNFFFLYNLLIFSGIEHIENGKQIS